MKTVPDAEAHTLYGASDALIQLSKAEAGKLTDARLEALEEALNAAAKEIATAAMVAVTNFYPYGITPLAWNQAWEAGCVVARERLRLGIVGGGR